MQFKFKRLEIPGVVLIEPEIFYDERGFFIETYKYNDFYQIGIRESFIQDCHSKSEKKGILRGLHYQKNPTPQGKIVRVIAGEIFDVAVDIRKGSPYYAKWIGVILSSENRMMLYIPPGFAHGFCTLTDKSEILYKYTKLYSPDDYRGIIWNDKRIGVAWPVRKPIISEKDEKLPALDKADNNFIFSEDSAI